MKDKKKKVILERLENLKRFFDNQSEIDNYDLEVLCELEDTLEEFLERIDDNSPDYWGTEGYRHSIYGE